MARINIEEKWWTDPRRSMLADILDNKYYVNEAAIQCWMIAQEYWKKSELVPGEVFATCFGAHALLAAGLAELRDGNDVSSNKLRTNLEHILTNREQDPTSLKQKVTNVSTFEQTYVYVKGSAKYFDWIKDLSLKRSLAGKRSAEKRRLKLGTAQPKRAIPRTNPEHDSTNPEHDSTNSNILIPVPVPVPVPVPIPVPVPNAENIYVEKEHETGNGQESLALGLVLDPPSSSGPSPKSKTKPAYKQVYSAAFETVWSQYRKKLLSQRAKKKQAFNVFETLRLTESDFQNLRKAITNYLAAKTDPQYVMGFERFLNEDWRVHLEAREPAMDDLDHATSERFSKYNRVAAKFLAEGKANTSNGRDGHD